MAAVPGREPPFLERIDDEQKSTILACLGKLGEDVTILLVKKLRDIGGLHRRVQNSSWPYLFIMAMAVFALGECTSSQLVRMYDYYMNGAQAFTQVEIALLESYEVEVEVDDDDDDDKIDVGEGEDEDLCVEEAVAKCRRRLWSESIPDEVLEILCRLGYRFKAGSHPYAIYSNAVMMLLRGDISAEDLLDLYVGMYNVQPCLTEDEKQAIIDTLSC